MSTVNALGATALRAATVVTSGLLLTACVQLGDQSVAEPTSVLSEVSTVAVTAEEQSGESTQESSISPTTATVTETTTAEPTTKKADSKCGTMSAIEAARAHIDELPGQQWPWTADYALTSYYDPCADLSPIVVTISNATVASPYHIMLFHQGEYLGTATYEAYPFTNITDVTDDSIDVMYKYLKPGEAHVEASGRTYATFYWDDSTQKVQMTGDVPPS